MRRDSGYYTCTICSEPEQEDEITWCDNCDSWICITCERDSIELESWMVTCTCYRPEIIECPKCTRHPGYVDISNKEIKIRLKEKYHIDIDEIKKDIIAEKIKQYKIDDGVGDCLNDGYQTSINDGIPAYYNFHLSILAQGTVLTDESCEKCRQEICYHQKYGG